MKNSELFDKHADLRKFKKNKKRKFNEGDDIQSSRAERVSFKNYIREVEESITLEAEQIALEEAYQKSLLND